MKRCTRCGANVQDTQPFCGTCGNDMRAVPVAPTPRVVPPVGEAQGSPYAYPQQQMTPYGGGVTQDVGGSGQSPTMRYLVIGAVVLLVACCCFTVGIVVGGFAESWVSGSMASPTPVRTPRPAAPAGGGALVWLLWYLLP